MGYKYECLTYLDVYQAVLTRLRTPKHACLQIGLYIWILPGLDYIYGFYRLLYPMDSTGFATELGWTG
jgi:hypothetical protein